LVSAQLHTADLLASRSENHPFVIAAREQEDLIRRQLNSEVAVAIRGLQVEFELCADHEKSLVSKSGAARGRMSRLAEGRAEYANLVSSVQNHARLVEAARKNLADARARQAGAHSASVISRIDGVEAGIRPAGPARKTVAAASGLGGLLLGFGLVFLFASPAAVASSLVQSSDNVNQVQPNVVRKSAANARVTVPRTSRYARTCNGPIARPRSVSEVFGMFRGMTLQEAVRSVEQRCK
jgi:uncharacterized protein involved in exopolysaccharide biosynthesis